MKKISCIKKIYKFVQIAGLFVMGQNAICEVSTIDKQTIDYTILDIKRSTRNSILNALDKSISSTLRDDRYWLNVQLKFRDDDLKNFYFPSRDIDEIQSLPGLSFESIDAKDFTSALSRDARLATDFIQSIAIDLILPSSQIDRIEFFKRIITAEIRQINVDIKASFSIKADPTLNVRQVNPLIEDSPTHANAKVDEERTSAAALISESISKFSDRFEKIQIASTEIFRDFLIFYNENKYKIQIFCAVLFVGLLIVWLSLLASMRRISTQIKETGKEISTNIAQQPSDSLAPNVSETKSIQDSVQNPGAEGHTDRSDLRQDVIEYPDLSTIMATKYLNFNSYSELFVLLNCMPPNLFDAFSKQYRLDTNESYKSFLKTKGLEILTHESEQRAIMVSIHALLTLAKQDLRIATLEISKSFFRKIPAQDLAVLFESADDESRRALLEVVPNSTIAFLTSKNFIELRHIETASKAPLNLELLESLAHAIQSKANEVSSNSRSDTIFQTLMEYMPTSSLDHFPADELRRVALNVEQIFVDNIDIVIGLTNKMSIADTSDFLATLSDIGRQSILAKLPEIRAKRVAVRSLEPTENGLKIRSHLLTVLKGNSSKEENRNQLNAAS